MLITGAASSWTAIQAPLPPGGVAALNFEATSELPTVACGNKASACVAVGFYRDQSGNDQGLLLTGPP
jgi:hypothetical protein